MPICTLIKEVIGSNGIAFTKPEFEVFVKDIKKLIKEFNKEVQEVQQRKVWRQKERQEGDEWFWHTEKPKENKRGSQGDVKGGRCVS